MPPLNKPEVSTYLQMDYLYFRGFQNKNTQKQTFFHIKKSVRYYANCFLLIGIISLYTCAPPAVPICCHISSALSQFCHLYFIKAIKIITFFWFLYSSESQRTIGVFTSMHTPRSYLKCRASIHGVQKILKRTSRQESVLFLTKLFLQSVRGILTFYETISYTSASLSIRC